MATYTKWERSKNFLETEGGVRDTTAVETYIGILKKRERETCSLVPPGLKPDRIDKIALALLNTARALWLTILSVKNNSTFWYL